MSMDWFKAQIHGSPLFFQRKEANWKNKTIRRSLSIQELERQSARLEHLEKRDAPWTWRKGVGETTWGKFICKEYVICFI